MDEEERAGVRATVSSPWPGFHSDAELLDKIRSEVESQVRKTVSADPPSAPGLEKHLRILASADARPQQEADIVVHGLETEEVNAVRRVLLTDTRFLGVDVVKISQNSSLVVDELLAHRIAHVPLRAPRSIVDRDGAVVQLVLRAAHEGQVPGVLDVMSDRLLSSDPRVTPQPGMRILRLQPGQSVDVVAFARPGTAREHTKWRAVHTAVVRPAGGVGTASDATGGERGVLLRVGTNWQADAVEAATEAVREVRRRLALAMEDVRQPGGPRVVGADPEVDEGAANVQIGGAYA